MKNNLKINLLLNIIYQLLNLLVPLITAPYISRVIGADGIGAYTYTYTIAYYFVLFAMLGINNYANRSIAQTRDSLSQRSNTFWNIYYIQLITSSMMILLYIIYLVFFVKTYIMIAAIQLILVISALFDINWFFFGLEQFKITVSRSIIIKVLSTCCVFILIKNADDLWLYTLIMATSTFFSQVILWVSLKNQVKFVKFDFKRVRIHFIPCVILFLSIIAVSLYRYLDKIMIVKFSNMSQLGYFENSEKIINAPLGIITALGTVMLPKMSNLIAAGDTEKGKYYIKRCMDFVCLMSFPMAFGLMAIAKPFSIIFFGDDFSACGDIILLLAPTIVFIAWANVIRMQYLIPKLLDKIFVISVFFGAFVNLFFNFILIPRYGAIGAAISTLIAEIGVCVFQTLCIRKELQIILYIKNAIIYFISSLIMFIVIITLSKIFSPSFTSIFLLIICGAFIYMVFVVLLDYRNKKERIITLIEKVRSFIKKNQMTSN